MTERDVFMSRLAKAREAGLKDVKFFFQPTQPMKPEDIFASVNEVDRAIEAGECTKHTEWDGNEPKASSILA